jgi:hypothetical protein
VSRSAPTGLQSGIVAAQTRTDPATTAAPPAPEDCSHPAPVVGVLAHEFSHYQGAIGPEGTRRTSTFYGPVLGGLPIQAWHCQQCGLLRLTYVDGRKEERRLFAGPQPGLLAEATPFDPQQEHYGLQARVSGVTVPPSMYTDLLAPYQPAPWAPPWQGYELPKWDALTWFTVVGLAFVIAGLFATGVLAVYDYTTPAAVGPVITITGYSFLAILIMQVLGAVQRHWFPFPPIAPSLAQSQRVQPALDGATKAVVTLLALTMLGLFVAAVLAVYTYSTAAAEGPVVVVTVIFALLALVIWLSSAITRRARRR